MLRVHLSDGKFDWIVCEIAMLCFDEVFIVFKQKLHKHFLEMQIF